MDNQVGLKHSIRFHSSTLKFLRETRTCTDAMFPHTVVRTPLPHSSREKVVLVMRAGQQMNEEVHPMIERTSDLHGYLQLK